MMIYHSKMRDKAPVEVLDLATAVQEVFGVNAFEKTRRREIVDARMAIMVAVRRMYTTTEIASSFNMDHSSVVHAARQHKSKYNTNPVKRYRLYRSYCDIYDFCVNRILNQNYNEYETISDVKEELAEEKKHRYELQQQVKDLQSLLSDCNKTNKELEKYRTAFRQVITEAKLKDEKAAKKD